MVVGEINAILGSLPRQYVSFSLNNSTKQKIQVLLLPTFSFFLLKEFFLKNDHCFTMLIKWELIQYYTKNAMNINDKPANIIYICYLI